MRCYGRNRARLLHEDVAEQSDFVVRTCPRCNRTLPASEFEGGRRIVNCRECRESMRERNRAAQARSRERRRG